MNDKFNKVMLVGILICLIIIAQKPSDIQVSSPNPEIDVNRGDQIIQLAPNRIAVIDNKENSGMRGTILIFDYDDSNQKLNYVSSTNYEDYFRNPSKHGVPTN